MSDFENVLRVVVMTAAVIFLPIAGLAALAAVRLIWKRGSAMSVEDRDAEISLLRARVDELERRGLVSGEYDAQLARLAEMEDRLDFAERLLAQRHEPVPPLAMPRNPSPPNGSAVQ